MEVINSSRRLRSLITLGEQIMRLIAIDCVYKIVSKY